MLRPLFISSALWLSAVSGPALAQQNLADAGTLSVSLDRALLTRLPDRAATVVVGNPSIADVTIQPGGLLVVTGKGYGATNLIALDRDGAVLMEKSVRVSGPQAEPGVVVVYRGVERETYSCAPNCDARAMPGDHIQFYGNIVGQQAQRGGQAQGLGAAQAAAPAR